MECCSRSVSEPLIGQRDSSLKPFAVVLSGSGLGSVLPDGAGAALCVLHLCDGTKGLGLSGASH